MGVVKIFGGGVWVGEGLSVFLRFWSVTCTVALCGDSFAFCVQVAKLDTPSCPWVHTPACGCLQKN